MNQQIPQDLINMVEDCVLETFLAAQKIYGQNFELPKIIYSDKLGKTGGYAYRWQNKIELNTFFLIHYGETFLETVIHECAQMIVTGKQNK